MLRTVRQAFIVCRKELKDSLRDRRALWSIIFSIVIGPVLIGFMMNRLADRQREADSVRIPMVGFVESLNLSFTTALVQYEVLRQVEGNKQQAESKEE